MAEQKAVLPAGIKPRDNAERELIESLDMRLQNADIDQLGWRGRQELSPLLQDLQKLSKSNFPAAEALWDRNDGESRDKPAFLDRRASELARAENTVEANQKGLSALSAGSTTAGVFEPPEQITKRFLKAGQDYHFRDGEGEVAFKDAGKSLQSKVDDPRVSSAMVEMAVAKGWTGIKVRGSDDFKREVWLQANLKGIAVDGYNPRDVDMARLNDLKSDRPITEKAPALQGREAAVIEAMQMKMRERGDSEAAIAKASAVASERFTNNRVFTGVLLDHGRAPYENNPKNAANYFVTLDTKDGPKTIWGSDLARAMSESKVERGQQVAVASTGRVNTPILATKDGERREVITTKTTWTIAGLDQLRDESRDKLVMQAEKGPQLKVYDRAAPREVERPSPRSEPSKAHDKNPERQR